MRHCYNLLGIAFEAEASFGRAQKFVRARAKQFARTAGAASSCCRTAAHCIGRRIDVPDWLLGIMRGNNGTPSPCGGVPSPFGGVDGLVSSMNAKATATDRKPTAVTLSGPAV